MGPTLSNLRPFTRPHFVSGASGSPGTANLLAWWAMDDASGNATDSHSGSHDLTVSGSPTYSRTGVVNDAILIDSNSEYFTKTSGGPTYPGLASGSVTMNAWVKGAALNSSGFILSWCDNSATNQILLLAVQDQSGTIVARQFTQAGSSGSEYGTTDLSDNAWHMITCVWRSATDRELYVDGASEATGSTSRSPTGLDALGIARLVDSSPLSIPPDGDVDEISLWDDALTPAEISWLYNSGSGRAYSDL